MTLESRCLRRSSFLEIETPWISNLSRDKAYDCVNVRTKSLIREFLLLADEAFKKINCHCH